MYDLIFAAVILVPLSYGAATDYQSRIIPDGVCAAVLMAGLAGAVLLPHGSIFFIPLWQRAAGLFPAAFMLALAYCKNGIGGGDIKLMAVLGFALGYYALVPVLFVAAIAALIWAKKQKEKSVPLAVFILVSANLWFLTNCISKY